MSKLYCLIYRPTGRVCEADEKLGICYHAFPSREAAQADADELNKMHGHVYDVARLPRHLDKPRRAQSGEQLHKSRRVLRKLKTGIPIYRKNTTSPHKRATFRVVFTGKSYQGAIIVHTDFGDSFVDEIWEAPTLDWLRRIACGYYPAIAKAFGPARNFVGV